MCTVTLSILSAQQDQLKNQTSLLDFTNLCDNTIEVRPKGYPRNLYFFPKETHNIPVSFENNSAVLWIRCNSKAAILQVGSDVSHITVKQDNNKTFKLTTNTGQELPL